LDETAQAFYEDLRRRYFPPERNLIPAHLTLFHHLPDEDHVYETLAAEADATAVFSLTEPGMRSIGRGVAVFLQSRVLTALHSRLSSAFDAHLIPQDRQGFRAHIVVQNKVSAEMAQLTLLQLQTAPLIEPLAVGLTLWRYLGGPWEHLRDFPFAG
jgi:hypothetical protein